MKKPMRIYTLGRQPEPKKEMVHYNKDDVKTYCGKKDARKTSGLRKEVTCNKCLAYSYRW